MLGLKDLVLLCMIRISLTKDNQTYTDKADYSRFLNVEFREVNGHINMLATPTREAGNAIMTLEIRRVYDGGSRGDTRQVIGGEIDYRFVINSTMNYSLSYTGDNVNVDGNNESIKLNSLIKNYKRFQFKYFSRETLAYDINI